MKKILVAVMLCAAFVLGHDAEAASKPKFKPFILASKGAGDLAAVTADVTAKLKSAGLEIASTHNPIDNVNIIVVTNDAMKKVATKTRRGGFGAAQRVSVTLHNGEIQVAYTNPRYMASAYRMEGDLGFAADLLEKALGKVEEYGMKKGMSDSDLRDYHYMFGMPYFDEPHFLGKYETYKEALDAVEKGLSEGVMGITKVYRIDLPGKEETVFGVAMNGAKGDGDQQDDRFLMSEIDFKDIRSSAHLPYEVLVSGRKIYAQSARFRIAISFPDLSMMGDNSFMNIMDSPQAIKKALTLMAGGKWGSK